MKVIAQIRGGLGNQLFIYAAGRALARKLGARLEVDGISGFQRDRLYRREYLLGHLGVHVAVARANDSFAGLGGRLRQKALHTISRLGVGRSRWQFADERTDWRTPPARKTYLRGYWQSERHFAAVAEDLRAELLHCQPPLLPATASELQQIHVAAEPVAVCMRSFAEVPVAHGPVVIPSSFYANAIAQLRSKLRAPVFFLFSDNPEWARKQLPAGLPLRDITPKRDNAGSCQDLILIRACRHFVIGNGTLHWWGAWMAREEGKTVLVPSAYADTHRYFYPASWSRL